MLRTILVPLDGSTLAERALAYATALSIRTGARLLLVRAVDVHTLPGVDGREAQSVALDEAERYLATTTEALKTRGFECDTATPFGSPAAWLAEEVGLRHADLIVMSTHGRTGPGRWLFGSVAEGVVAHSPVPVLIERTWQAEQREPLLAALPSILIPLDGSAFSEAALVPAATLAEDLGAGLVLLRVEARAKDVLEDELSGTIVYVDRQEEWSRTDAISYLERISSSLIQHHPGLPVRIEVLLGEAAESIAQATHSSGAALVLMATHGRTGLRRSILGSVAGRVLERGTAPLILIGPAFAASTVDDGAHHAVA